MLLTKLLQASYNFNSKVSIKFFFIFVWYISKSFVNLIIFEITPFLKYHRMIDMHFFKNHIMFFISASSEIEWRVKINFNSTSFCRFLPWKNSNRNRKRKYYNSKKNWLAEKCSKEATWNQEFQSNCYGLRRNKSRDHRT